MSPPIRAKIGSLVSVADNCAKALRAISRAAKEVNGLRSGALFGSIGFGVGASGTVLACAFTSFAYAPFLVPGFAMIGLLLGVALARDGTDRANERIGDLIDQAWELRDRDIRMLDTEIKIARRSRSRGVDALEQKRAVLMIQSPEQLIRHYGLIDRRSVASDGSTPPLGPTTEQVLLSWKRPSAGDGGSSDGSGEDPSP